MKKFMKKEISVFAITFLVISAGMIIFVPSAHAAISDGTVAGNAAADLVAGATDADYNIAFDTNIATTATAIIMTFPSGYAITDGSLATSTAICNSGCTVAGTITVGTATTSVVTMTGSAASSTITLVVSAIDLGTGTGTAFRILQGIQNPTLATTTGTFTIMSNANGEVAQSNIAGVVITAGTATKLGYLTQPAHAGTPHGNITSGIIFATQPIVAGQDTYGNTNTTFVGAVTVTKTSGAGTFAATATTSMDAVSGIADFAGKGFKYTAVADQETFVLTATSTGLTLATSSALIADVVATKFLVTLATNAPAAGAADKLTATAANAQNTTDTDYDPTGKTFTFVDSGALALATHTSPTGVVPTIPSSASFRAAFSSGVASSTTFTLVKAEVLGTITVSDTVLSGTSASVTVHHNTAASFTGSTSTLAPYQRIPFNMTLTAVDSSGNTADGANTGTVYEGTVTFSTTAQAGYTFSPTLYLFVSGDVGTKTFTNGVTLAAKEDGVSITATDGSISGTITGINVQLGTQGGGGSYMYVPAVSPTPTPSVSPTPTPTPTPTVTPVSGSGQQALIDTLLARIRVLILQVQQMGGQVPGAEQYILPTQYTFTRNLSFGMTREDIRQLQMYLNAHGAVVAASGAGSIGNETTRFGAATRAALMRFQANVGISPAAGYFGPITRAYVNSH